MTTTKEAAGLERAVLRAEEWAGTMPAKEAVKLRPADWHAVCKLGREAAQEIRTLRAQVEELRRERDTWKEIAEKTAASGSSISRKLDTAKAQLAEAEAGIAEAVKALEPFASKSDRLHSGYDAGIAAGDNPYVYVAVSHLRAARAFVEKHKESGT